MATSQPAGHDLIHPGPSALGSDSGGRKSSSSSADKDLDAKNPSGSPAQYEMDPEKQSTRVGSIRREGEDEPQGWQAKWGLKAIWERFKPLWHTLIWMLFTALVAFFSIHGVRPGTLTKHGM